MSQQPTILDRADEAYQRRSSSASSVCRQLCFAGIAVIWAYRVFDDGRYFVPIRLAIPSALIVAALAVDLLQYTLATLLWGGFRRMIERKIKRRPAIAPTEAPAWINWPAVVLFWLKIVLAIVAYVFILIYLWPIAFCSTEVEA